MTLLLVALLPLHALLVTVLTRILLGPGHAPMTSLALWKEGALCIIVALALLEVLRRRIIIDAIDLLIVALSFVALCVTALTHGDWLLAAYGVKYDLLALWVFLILRRASWSADFCRRLPLVVLWVGCAIAAYAILTLFLPATFFTWLGYSDAHSLYLPHQPLAAFQFIADGSVRRLQGTMSGPNQLGIWLLLPWAIACAECAHASRRRTATVAAYLLLLALFLTFSRGAWIAAAAIGLTAVVRSLLARYGGIALWPRWVRWGLGGGLGIVLVCGVLAAVLFPDHILRRASSSAHIERPLEAIARIAAQPLGGGLGSAGPASHRVSDACVFLPAGADASWATDRPSLCVFVGAVQVQPLGAACRCAFLPENWYLQIGVEAGIAGLLLFCLLVLAVFERLWAVADGAHLAEVALLGFLGIGIVALVLHAWEDAAVAYTAWLLVAVALPPAVRRSLR